MLPSLILKTDQSVTDILNSYFEIRQKKRPNYSVRAFARDLNLSPSFLSQVLTAKRGLSLEKAEIISKSLKLSVEEHIYFIAKVGVSFSRSNSQKVKAEKLVEQIKADRSARQLSIDEFTVIADWYHLGIFQCLFLRDYRKYCCEEGEVQFLCRFLKITPDEAGSALTRMKFLKLIESGKDAHQPIKDNIAIKKKVPAAAVRKFHRQVIQKALVAMETQAIQDRYFHCTTLTLRKSDLPAILEEFKMFYESIGTRYSKKETAPEVADAIYAFSAQWFSLSHGLVKP